MKFRVSLFLAIVLLILIFGVTWFTLSRGSPAPEQIFSATINRDCAPWDGSAFTISIPMEDTGISISVYEAPDIKLPITFSFPDNTMSVGNALLILPTDSAEPLTGRVSFQGVKQGSPVEGIFDLTTETGKRFKGRFIAEWGNEIVYCG